MAASSPVESDPGRPGNRDDGVAVGGVGTEAHQLADTRSDGEPVNHDRLGPVLSVAGRRHLWLTAPGV
jgi:hypothetical protein